LKTQYLRIEKHTDLSLLARAARYGGRFGVGLGVALGLIVITFVALNVRPWRWDFFCVLLCCVFGMVVGFGVFFRRVGVVLGAIFDGVYERRNAAEKGDKLRALEIGEAATKARAEAIGRSRQPTSEIMKESPRADSTAVCHPEGPAGDVRH
jgi:hypothetical protein